MAVIFTSIPPERRKSSNFFKQEERRAERRAKRRAKRWGKSAAGRLRHVEGHEVGRRALVSHAARTGIRIELVESQQRRGVVTQDAGAEIADPEPWSREAALPGRQGAAGRHICLNNRIDRCGVAAGKDRGLRLDRQQATPGLRQQACPINAWMRFPMLRMCEDTIATLQVSAVNAGWVGAAPLSIQLSRSN